MTTPRSVETRRPRATRRRAEPGPAGDASPPHALDIAAALEELGGAMHAHADEGRAAPQKAYMKSALDFVGIGAPALRDVARAFCAAHPGVGREDLRGLAAAAFAGSSFDLRSAVLVVLERNRKKLRPDDLPWLIEVARTAACWAHVDQLATKLVGSVLAAAPEERARLREWARDSSFWVRRTALLATLEELRKGGGDFALWAEIAVPMLPEREFFIRKALGWVLRDVSRKRPELAAAFLAEHGAAAAGLTFREGSRGLPEATRAALVAAREAR